MMALEDEVIQDSEDEEMVLPRDKQASSSAVAEMGNAGKVDAVPLPRPPQTNLLVMSVDSTRNNNTTSTSTAQTPSTSTSPLRSSRPRPRPAFKGALAKKSNDSSADKAPSPGPASTSANPLLILTTSTSAQAGPTAIPDLAVHDADMYTRDIAERAKLRSRARTTKATGKQSVRPADPDVIDISSDDDILNLHPPPNAPKSKSAPRNLPSPKKRAKTTHIPTNAFMTETSSAVIPVATSDFISQLPPSDPPPPSTATAPIPTPPQAVAGSNSSPLSSPIPLPPPVPKRKQRTLPTRVIGSDEDAGDSRHNVLRKDDSKLVMPPPPPFFAEPSSSVHASDTLVEYSSPAKTSDGTDVGTAASSSTKGKGKVKTVVDDFEDDWPVEPPPKPKARSRKRAVVADEEDWQGDDAPKTNPKARQKAAEHDEDEWKGDDAPKPKPARKSRRRKADEDEEDEWVGDAPPKRKPRAPVNKKGKKSVVEVVIEQPAPRSGRKGKAGKKAEQQQPKGDEVVVVSGDELSNVIAPPDVDHVRVTPPASTAIPSPLTDPEAEPAASGEILERQTTPISPRSSKTVASVLRDGDSILNSPRSKNKGKGKRRAVVDSDDEENADDSREQLGSPPKRPRRDLSKGRKSAPVALEQEQEKEDDEDEQDGSSSFLIKENLRNRVSSYSTVTAAFKSPIPAPGTAPRLTLTHRSYTIGSGKSTPMSELLKKVNSQPGSPFASPRPQHSPYAKTSKSLLRKIAPLHPNRRDPPPQPPRPPPPKKTKKQLELEEKWEMELEESVDGWYCLPEEERLVLRRAKRDAEMGFED